MCLSTLGRSAPRALLILALGIAVPVSLHAQNTGPTPDPSNQPPFSSPTDSVTSGTLPGPNTRCNNVQAEQQIEYPGLAMSANVYAGKSVVYATVMSDGRVAVDHIVTSDPAFNDAALAGIRAVTCVLPAGTPLVWPIDFMVDGEPATTLANIRLRKGGIDPIADQRRILMLLPQGIDPSNDHDGLNDLSRRLNSALGARIAEDLKRRGIDVIGVLDQRPVGIQEKLETYAASFLARHIMVVTVETVPVNDETELRYRVQYSDDDLIIKSGHLEAVVPSGAMARTYKIKGSKSGAAHLAVETIASDFIKGLDDDGRLKGLAVAHQ